MEMTSTRQELQIEVLEIKKGALTLRAVNHRLRQQMLRLIHQNGRITVSKIYQQLRIEQSVASQHLAILRKVGFVQAERNGKFIFYSVNYNHLKQVHQIVGKLLESK